MKKLIFPLLALAFLPFTTHSMAPKKPCGVKYYITDWNGHAPEYAPKLGNALKRKGYTSSIQEDADILISTQLTTTAMVSWSPAYTRYIAIASIIIKEKEDGTILNNNIQATASSKRINELPGHVLEKYKGNFQDDDDGRFRFKESFLKVLNKIPACNQVKLALGIRDDSYGDYDHVPQNEVPQNERFGGPP